MKIGRKIFYDLTTGNIITDTGERQGSVVTTTIEQDIATYSALSERNRDTFGVIELEFGEHAQDFAESKGYKVNLDSKKLEFSYPDPSEPEAPPIYETPLSEKVASLEQENAEILFSNALQEGRITGLEEENATILFELAAIKGGIANV